MTGKERLNRLHDQRWQLLPSLLQRNADKAPRDHAAHLYEALGYLIQDKRLSESARTTLRKWLEATHFDRLANRTAQWVEQYGYMMDGQCVSKPPGEQAGSLYRRVWMEWLSFIQKVISARSSFDLFKAGNRLIPVLTQGHRELDNLFARPLPEVGHGLPDTASIADTPFLLRPKHRVENTTGKPSWAWPFSKTTVFIPKRMIRKPIGNPDTQSGY
ncbi:hypothetical protein HNQ59_000448 [Chitinivorax tropicus]|uniref:Uncharacterized protein n=1 Tax=Chitinivorax tropicus TaxID=714531 RepID=A0A840MKV0_9PROT|nr:hypothetical protein [Chitinivorax tropicus]MBB5017186.1 hypothetical protein [Chitinivorax tropicus]